MITTTPLPPLAPLLAARFLTHPDGPALAAPWLRAGDLGGVWLSRSAWSLALVADMAARQRGRRPVIAVPEYICGQSLWPLRQGRADLVFYPVDGGDLTPRWAAMDGMSADLLLLVHYFGHANDAAEARRWCDRQGALLVEDAAHVLVPGPGIGEWGDVVAYSPHKLVAVPDGAVLVLGAAAQTLAPHLPACLDALGGARPRTGGWWLKRLVQKTPLGSVLAAIRPSGQADFLTDPPAGPLPWTPMPSPMGAALLARADLAAAARRRSANAAALAAAIGGLADWAPLFRDFNDHVPYRLVMRAADGDVASALYARLRAARLPVESWPDLPPEAVDPDTVALRRSCLMLPCHQSLRSDRLAAAYARALGGRA